MTVRELIQALAGEDMDRKVVIGGILHSPFAVVNIKVVLVNNLLYPNADEPIYIVAEKK